MEETFTAVFNNLIRKNAQVTICVITQECAIRVTKRQAYCCCFLRLGPRYRCNNRLLSSGTGALATGSSQSEASPQRTDSYPNLLVENCFKKQLEITKKYTLCSIVLNGTPCGAVCAMENTWKSGAERQWVPGHHQCSPHNISSFSGFILAMSSQIYNFNPESWPQLIWLEGNPLLGSIHPIFQDQELKYVTICIMGGIWSQENGSE